jgi:hypothetical protein
MEPLKQLMTLIDANSDKLPEGEYLAMCSVLKEVHGSMKSTELTLQSSDYYDLEEELGSVTMELERLRKERDTIHYRTRMTKHMKREAIREYAFTEGLHSLREYTAEALEEAGIKINCNELYGKYLETFNYDIFQKKKAISLTLQDTREYRDRIIREMIDVM